MKPNWSTVAICRNEEKTIGRFINSLKEFLELGGDLVIVDTGSTDNTVAVAKAMGVDLHLAGNQFSRVITEQEAAEVNKEKVEEGEQPILLKCGETIFDFHAARNYAANFSKNNWVAMHDIDETYTVLNIDKINEIISDDSLNNLEYEFVFAHDGFGNPSIQFVQSKFYRKDRLEWQNIVHEVLQPVKNVVFHSNKPMNRYVLKDIIFLEHWQNFGTERGNYLRGLALDCWLNPDNDRNSHYLGRELFWTGRPKSAIKEFERHIAMNRWPAEKAQSYNFMGDCYEQIGKPLEAVVCWNKAFEIDGSRRESLMRLAWFYFRKEDWMKVIAYGVATLEIPWHGFYANNKAHYTNEPHELLYIAYWWAGQKEKSKEHLLKALDYAPYHKKYLDDTKFYFEYPDNKIDGWMWFCELQFLYEKAKKFDTIAEVGSWKGRSTHALLSGCKGKVTAVDHFLGSKGEEAAHSEAKGDVVFEQFDENTKQFFNLSVRRKDSLTAAKDFPDNSFDMIFIDGSHQYEEVKADIQAWKNKAKILLCGHDYTNWPDVKKAVDEELGNVMTCGSIWYQFRPLPLVDIIIPTLGRPAGLQRVLKSITQLNYPPDKIRVYVMNDEPRIGVPKRVKEGVEQSTGDYVCYASNDMEFTPDSLLLAVRDSVNQNKALVSFNAGPVYPDEGNICEHFIIRRNFIPQLENKEVFSTEFWHTGCDNWLWAQAKKLGQAFHSTDAIITHKHFTRGAVMDDIYKLGWSHVDEDRKLLKEKLVELEAHT